MTTAVDIITVARSQLGYVETGTNHTKYWAELDPKMQGQPWCAGFASWVFKHAGAPLPAMGKPYGFVYVPSAMAYARAHGLWDASGRYAPGDVVCYGGGAHTGIIVTDNGSTMVTIEGNTSSGESGSQTNGGMVALRHRPHGAWVNGVVKTSRLLGKTPPPVQPKPKGYASPVRGPFPLPVGAGFGINLHNGGPAYDARARYGIVEIQALLKQRVAPGIATDGRYGPTTERYVRVWTAANGPYAATVVNKQVWDHMSHWAGP